MNGVTAMLIAGVIGIFLFAIGWKLMFGTRTRKSSKATRSSREGFKSHVNISAIRVRNERFVTLSNALNFLPFGRLTPEKKEEIDKKLASSHKGETEIKIAEEMHCMQWAYAMLVLVAVIVLMIFWKGFGLLLLAIPMAFKIPYLSIMAGDAEIEETLVTEFPNFFSVYYVQFKRVGTSVRLADVVQSYKNLAPYEMKTFISQIEQDLSSGESHALKNLDRRYCHNPDVHRFCALAATVSRGDARAEKIVESFQTELEHNTTQRRRAIVQKRMLMVEKVQGAMLYGITTALLVVTFVFVATG